MHNKEPKIAKILTGLINSDPRTNGNATALADAIGIHQPTVQRIAAGKSRNPRLENLERIADFFGISVNQLVGKDPIIKGVNSRAANYFNKLTKRIPKITFEREEIEKILDSSNIESHKGGFMEISNSDAKCGDNSFSIIVSSRYRNIAPIGSLIVFDPDAQPENESYVIASFPDDPDYYIMQYVKIAGTNYLKPAEEDLPPISISVSGATIHARAVWKFLCEKM